VAWAEVRLPPPKPGRFFCQAVGATPPSVGGKIAANRDHRCSPDARFDLARRPFETAKRTAISGGRVPRRFPGERWLALSR